MENLMRKYAKVLLKSCLKVEDSQPLFISFNVERLNEAEFLGQRNGQFRITDAIYKPQEDLWYFDAIIEQKY